ncbi:hypothetical protein MSAR_46820 [Mycolicibacterium sarraceniae]|uniref:Uncharacterized protein n=1 Tax=Mycolicibacterium sarraceniae TaxID=1534348 RepID=A0A7I7T0F8_9MYCO|nr:hypothetical protein MSAR_46820 [Mycolicibacterium sarraceniae]
MASSWRLRTTSASRCPDFRSSSIALLAERNADNYVSLGWREAQALAQMGEERFPMSGLDYTWQMGHQNTLRPSSTAVRIGVLHTRHGSPARR